MTDGDIDIFDREAVFIERHLRPLVAAHPRLKYVRVWIHTEWFTQSGSHRVVHTEWFHIVDHRDVQAIMKCPTMPGQYHTQTKLGSCSMFEKRFENCAIHSTPILFTSLFVTAHPTVHLSRIVLEHITTAEACDFVRACDPSRVAATLTAHHLLYSRNALFAGGVRPHMYGLGSDCVCECVWVRVCVWGVGWGGGAWWRREGMVGTGHGCMMGTGRVSVLRRRNNCINKICTFVFSRSCFRISLIQKILVLSPFLDYILCICSLSLSRALSAL